MARSRPASRGRAAISASPTGARSRNRMAQMYRPQGATRMKKSSLAALLLAAAALAGCSSTPLNDVPVENKSAQPTTTAPPAAQSQVAPVTTGADQGTDQGPRNVARIIYFDFDSNVIKP